MLNIIGNCFKDRCICEATLESNGTLKSDNGRYKLKFRDNGELDVCCAAQYIWSSNTANSSATKLDFQNDGNLVLYANSGATVWTTDTHSIFHWVSDKLVLQNNRNLVMSLSDNKVEWSSGSNFVCQNVESPTNITHAH